MKKKCLGTTNIFVLFTSKTFSLPLPEKIQNINGKIMLAVKGTLVKIDSNTTFNLADFQPFYKVGNDKRIIDSGKKRNLGERILHKCKFNGKLCTYYFSYA